MISAISRDVDCTIETVEVFIKYSGVLTKFYSRAS